MKTNTHVASRCRGLAGAAVRVKLAMVASAVLLTAVPRTTRADESGREVVEETVLHHGAVTMRLTSSPLRLSGPGTDLMVRGTTLSGLLEDGRYDVELSAQRAEGQGPEGRVSLSFTRGAEGALAVRGEWNGQPVQLTFTSSTIEGRLVHHVGGTDRALESCRYDIDETAGKVVSGLSTCLGEASSLRYTVDPVATLPFNQPDVATMMIAYLAAAPAAPRS